MTPKKLQTRDADRPEARRRRQVAEKYLEVARLIDSEDGLAINVTVGLAVLAGIAAGDAICASAIGRRYSGPDHAAAADLLGTVEAALGRTLRSLIGFKPAAHYGSSILSDDDRKQALRAAGALVDEARTRTT